MPNATLDVFAPKAHQAAANAKLAEIEGVAFRGSISRAGIAAELAARACSLSLVITMKPIASPQQRRRQQECLSSPWELALYRSAFAIARRALSCAIAPSS